MSAPRLAALLLSCCGALLPALVAATPALLIREVTLIDPLQDAQAAQDLLIEDGRIAAIGAAASRRAPADARQIPARGQFLIPGLWDMHVHVLRAPRPEVYFPLLIAQGITGVRDMGGDEDFAQLRRWREEIAAGTRIGPRFVAPGPFLDGPYPSIPRWSRVIDSSAQARAAVAELQAQGADFLKVFNRLSRASYFALADEARRRHLVFAGHVPGAVSAREAAEAGQHSIEHLFNVAFTCSSREAELMQRKAAVMAGGEAESRRQARRAYLRDALDSFDAARCQALYQTFVRQQTWQVPTLVQRRSFAYPQQIQLDAAQLAYVPRSQLVFWRPDQDARLAGREAEDAELERRSFERDRSLIAAMAAAGVRILAGTDGGDPYRLPGFALHEELAELVAAGLTPQQALRSASSDAAEFLGLQAQLGRIAPGYIADLLLLDADPLTDIGNTRRIAAVIQNGVYRDRAELQRLREQARAAAAAN
ncbi:Amidohydrolase family protein [Solimonas aquatica]|uniref:Amidohydrolase family protein n=1 Tax=Solimonas aquatica TaxID=489703 RepID=A0A1H9ETZ5_9GAMM|nr:amidohydrolase family protein [Solimonas aquatica]SEQ28703.1 Amidohydrolase family protein [Solimonas aquatica]